MNLKNILYPNGKNDECYTPKYVVEEILPFLDKKYIYWCPFDNKESQFVEVLVKNGFNVVYSHVDNGQDFYTYEPLDWDIIISNPPFTNKRKIFERALSFNKPFALIMSNVWLNDSAPKILFREKDMQLLMFKNRIKFMNNGVINNKITFSSSFFCYNILPKQIIISDK